MGECWLLMYISVPNNRGSQVKNPITSATWSNKLIENRLSFGGIIGTWPVGIPSWHPTLKTWISRIHTQWKQTSKHHPKEKQFTVVYSIQ